MTQHTDLLNYLIKNYDLKTYLEIGVQGKLNFNSIKIVIENKVGVDPDPAALADHVQTSDDFFKENEREFDLIFIDGNHTKEQVERDFNNALNSLTEKGFIVLHDTVPVQEERTRVPRETKQWNGDVYKFAAKLGEVDGIDFCTVGVEHGGTIVWFDLTKRGQTIMEEITWEYFKDNQASLLRFNNKLPSWNK